MKKKILVILPVFVLAICFFVAECKDANKHISVISVKLNKNELTLDVIGNTWQLEATIEPVNATNRNVVWHTDREDIASVDTMGLVTAVGTGCAVITVTTDDGGKTDICQLTVPEQIHHVTGVTLNTNRFEIRVSETKSLTANVVPDDANNKEVNWSSDNEHVATVSSEGVVTAKYPGPAMITVTTDDGGFTAACHATVVTYTTTVNSGNQHIIKGLGGGLPWPGTSGFPITSHPEGMKNLLGMGISVARVYWHNQYQMFDEYGDPTDRGKTIINGFIDEIRWLNQNNIPYNMDGGINNMPRKCYFNDPNTGHLLEEYEPVLVKSILHVLNAVKNSGLKLPAMVVPFNEPSAPVNGGSNNPGTGAMKREQCVRIIKLLRAEMDQAGFNDILSGYSENGEAMYANFYAGNDIGGRPDAYGGIFVNVAGGEKNWPFFNPASSRYDAGLDAATGAFTTHSYWPGNGSITDYVNGYDLTAKGRDNWMTEYCLWGGNYNQVTANYNQELIRKFISDIVFFKFNYWEFWNLWNLDGPPCTDRLSSGSRNPAAYYVLAKIFNNIRPGATYVRRLTTSIPGFTVGNATAMNAAAFVSPDKTVVVLVNSSSAAVATNLKGLYGASAKIFQIAGNDNNCFNTDMSLVDTPGITDATIAYIAMPRNTVTIVVTDGGYK